MGGDVYLAGVVALDAPPKLGWCSSTSVLFQLSFTVNSNYFNMRRGICGLNLFSQKQIQVRLSDEYLTKAKGVRSGSFQRVVLTQVK